MAKRKRKLSPLHKKEDQTVDYMADDVKNRNVVTVEVRPHYCNFCSKHFTRPDLLIHHIVLNHANAVERQGDSIVYNCQVCKKVFQTEASFLNHKCIYTKQKEEEDDDSSHVCEVCGKKYQSGSLLKVHMQCHAGYKCNVCNREFRFYPSLWNHAWVHTLLKPYTCTVCGKGFGRQYRLRYHEVTHSDDRPYKCHHCKKTFKLKGSLTSHERMHKKAHKWKSASGSAKSVQKGSTGYVKKCLALQKIFNSLAELQVFPKREQNAETSSSAFGADVVSYIQSKHLRDVDYQYPSVINRTVKASAVERPKRHHFAIASEKISCIFEDENDEFDASEAQYLPQNSIELMLEPQKKRRFIKREKEEETDSEEISGNETDKVEMSIEQNNEIQGWKNTSRQSYYEREIPGTSSQMTMQKLQNFQSALDDLLASSKLKTDVKEWSQCSRYRLPPVHPKVKNQSLNDLVGKKLCLDEGHRRNYQNMTTNIPDMTNIRNTKTTTPNDDVKYDDPKSWWKGSTDSRLSRNKPSKSNSSKKSKHVPLLKIKWSSKKWTSKTTKSGRGYKCQLCEKRYKHKPSLYRHLSKYHQYHSPRTDDKDVKGERACKLEPEESHYDQQRTFIPSLKKITMGNRQALNFKGKLSSRRYVIHKSQKGFPQRAIAQGEQSGDCPKNTTGISEEQHNESPKVGVSLINPGMGDYVKISSDRTSTFKKPMDQRTNFHKAEYPKCLTPCTPKTKDMKEKIPIVRIKNLKLNLCDTANGNTKRRNVISPVKYRNDPSRNVENSSQEAWQISKSFEDRPEIILPQHDGSGRENIDSGRPSSKSVTNLCRITVFKANENISTYSAEEPVIPPGPCQKSLKVMPVGSKPTERFSDREMPNLSAAGIEGSGHKKCSNENKRGSLNIIDNKYLNMVQDGQEKKGKIDTTQREVKVIVLPANDNEQSGDANLSSLGYVAWQEPSSRNTVESTLDVYQKRTATLVSTDQKPSNPSNLVLKNYEREASEEQPQSKLAVSEAAPDSNEATSSLDLEVSCNSAKINECDEKTSELPKVNLCNVNEKMTATVHPPDKSFVPTECGEKRITLKTKYLKKYWDYMKTATVKLNLHNDTSTKLIRENVTKACKFLSNEQLPAEKKQELEKVTLVTDQCDNNHIVASDVDPQGRKQSQASAESPNGIFCTFCNSKFNSTSTLKHHVVNQVCMGKKVSSMKTGKKVVTELIADTQNTNSKETRGQILPKIPYKTTCSSTLSQTEENDFTDGTVNKSETVLSHCCKICFKGFATAATLKIHMKVHNYNSVFSEVQSQSDVKNSQDNDTSNHLGSTKNLIAKRGPMGEKSMETVQRKSNPPKPKPFSCDICGKLYTIRSYLLKHRENGKCHPRYECRFCKKGFNTEMVWKQHMLNETAKIRNKEFTCLECSTVFCTTAALDFHRSKMTCMTCAKSFSCSYLYNTHKNLKLCNITVLEENERLKTCQLSEESDSFNTDYSNADGDPADNPYSGINNAEKSVSEYEHTKHNLGIECSGVDMTLQERNKDISDNWPGVTANDSRNRDYTAHTMNFNNTRNQCVESTAQLYNLHVSSSPASEALAISSQNHLIENGNYKNIHKSGKVIETYITDQTVSVPPCNSYYNNDGVKIHVNYIYQSTLQNTSSHVYVANRHDEPNEYGNIPKDNPLAHNRYYNLAPSCTFEGYNNETTSLQHVDPVYLPGTSRDHRVYGNYIAPEASNVQIYDRPANVEIMDASSSFNTDRFNNTNSNTSTINDIENRSNVTNTQGMVLFPAYWPAYGEAPAYIQPVGVNDCTHQCLQCGAHFYTLSDLVNHEVVHDNVYMGINTQQ